MVHNPTCGCQNCFPINYPDRVNPHDRYFNYGSVNDFQRISTTRQSDPFEWVKKESTTFCTSCWWCNVQVYFHRNANGGCVLFDKLGSPWPIHECWEIHKNEQQDAKTSIIENRIKQIKSVTVNSYQYIRDIDLSITSLRGFILGYDSSKRVIPTLSEKSDPQLNLRYIVFLSIDGCYYRLLAPENQMENIKTYSYVDIEIENYKKNSGKKLSFLRRVKEVSVKSSKVTTKQLIIDYDYLSIVDKAWTIQRTRT